MTKYTEQGSDERVAKGICISVKRVGPGDLDLVFCCNGTVPAAHRAEGYGRCKRCADEEYENYRNAESAAARRFEEMSY